MVTALAVTVVLLVISLVALHMQTKKLNKKTWDLKRKEAEFKSKYREPVNTRKGIKTQIINDTQNKDDIQLSNINKLLTSILEINLKNNSISSAGESILSVLNQFYGMDNITLFVLDSTNTSKKLKILNTNVNKQYYKNMETYWNKEFSNMNGRTVKVQSSVNGNLTYVNAQERGISFSNFTLLIYDREIIGAILLENKDSEIFNDSYKRLSLYEKVLENTALVLQNVIKTDMINKMTYTDKLTQIYNRRYIDSTLHEQMTVHNNLDLSMSIVIFDIDKFKNFNDTYGHLFGDEVLIQVARIMKESLKNKGVEGSWVARYGGEEFILFFPRAQPDKVEDIVEYLRSQLAKSIMEYNGTTTSITASFGIKHYSPSTSKTLNGLEMTYTDLISDADKAMYQSKELGRNRVTVFKS